MFQINRIAAVALCVLGLSACDSQPENQPDVQLQDNTLITSLPEPVRQIARLGTEPLEVRINVNGNLARPPVPVSNDISGNLDLTVDMPADQANNITVQWLAVVNGTRVLLAENTFRTQPNQETATVSIYTDEGERFDPDMDQRFSLQEVLENRNPLNIYDLEVPLQTGFVAAREELIPGENDGDTSFSAGSDTTRADTNTDANTTFSLRHDGTNLILYVCGQDEVLVGDTPGSTETYWHDDTVFLYIDGADSDNSAYDNLDDFQFGFVRSTQELIVSKGESNTYCPDGSCVFHQFVDPSSSTQCVYELNVSIPFEDLNITLGEAAGFDLEITDDDDGGLREGSSGFVGFMDDSSTSPGTFGTIILR